MPYEAILLRKTLVEPFKSFLKPSRRQQGRQEFDADPIRAIGKLRESQGKGWKAQGGLEGLGSGALAVIASLGLLALALALLAPQAVFSF